jgi:hypothetical protein
MEEVAKRKMMRLTNQRGIGMVQVLVAVGMLGALSLAVMQMTKNSSEAQRKMNFNFAVNTFSNSIQTELNKKDTCTVSLKGKKKGDTIHSIHQGIVDPLSKELIPDRMIAGIRRVEDAPHGLYIDSMILEKDESQRDILRVVFRAGRVSLKAINEPTSVDTPTRANHQLLTQEAKLLGGSQIRRDFLINASKDAEEKIIECYSSQSTETEEIQKKFCAVEAKMLAGHGKTGATPHPCNYQIILTPRSFEGPGTYAIPENITPGSIKVKLLAGGGGGGGGAGGNTKAGEGGRAGSYLEETLPDALAGASCSLLVGPGGEGGEGGKDSANDPTKRPKDGAKGSSSTINCQKNDAPIFAQGASGGEGGRAAFIENSTCGTDGENSKDLSGSLLGLGGKTSCSPDYNGGHGSPGIKGGGGGGGDDSQGNGGRGGDGWVEIRWSELEIRDPLGNPI